MRLKQFQLLPPLTLQHKRLLADFLPVPLNLMQLQEKITLYLINIVLKVQSTVLLVKENLVTYIMHFMYHRKRGQLLLTSHRKQVFMHSWYIEYIHNDLKKKKKKHKYWKLLTCSKIILKWTGTETWFQSYKVIKLKEWQKSRVKTVTIRLIQTPSGYSYWYCLTLNIQPYPVG